MSKFKSQKGFTLAELLVVVAIIAVLVAIAIPVFSAQLKKARLAVDHAAIRDAYAIVQIANNLQEVEIDGVTKTFDQFTNDQLFVLSKDCSSLLNNSFPMPENIYRFQADGADGLWGLCPECNGAPWDNFDIEGITPTKAYHIKNLPIYVTYVQSENRLVVGWLSG